ncbi:hypothetical protein [Marinobacter fonticola]|uniref:hypothetical protein n=1 Tax=Marinobacter fonticola TaxID=2603215 RepID=UPI0011E6DE09|nr:hypothetical protein [Marinobacter fonticola]
MFKKTLISLAVASSVGLTGCLDDGSSGKNANPDYQISNPNFDGKTWPIFNPLQSKLPIPNDLIFDSEQGDGTFGVSDSSPPVTTALNELSGASTVAPAVIQFNGQIDASTVVAGKTVFLLELTYASGDPVQGLGNQEPPTVAGLANVRADVVTLDGTSAIRVLPLEPLDPRKRYVAAVTTDIKDVNGDNIVGSPSYQSLSDAEQPVGNEALAPVKALITGLWEPLVQAATQLPASKIALSYSFTTSNDEKVLQYIAEPGAWFSDQLSIFVKVSAAKAAMQGGASDYASVSAVVEGAVSTFPTPELKVALSPIFDAPPPSGCNGLTGQNAFDCAGTGLAGSFASLLPPLKARGADDFNFDLASLKPVPLVSAVTSPILTSLGADSDSVLAAQGTVSLPYYLGTSAPGVVTESWEADSTLASTLNKTFESLGLTIPQADPSVSTAVNYVFPFPKKQADVEVPVLALLPNPADFPSPVGVIMYQHGITTDRSSALTFGTALAAKGYAVIAIDQPLHGVAPFTEAEQRELGNTLLQSGQNNGLPASLAPSETNVDSLIAGQLNVGFVAAATGQTPEQAQTTINTVLGGGTTTDPGLDAAIKFLASAENTVANAGSTIPGLAPMAENERHFGLYAPQPSSPAPISYENGVGDSGSLFINLTSFLTTRDNLRQSVVDQINLRASLQEALTIGPVSIPANSDVYFAGHSLGTITGTPFVASVNANQTVGVNPKVAGNDIISASMLTPGGGIVRLLENSPTFAPRILLGLQQSAGLEQGDANLESYFNVFQATVDTADPINFVDNLSTSGTPVLYSEVENDAVIPNAADEQRWGIAALDNTFTPAQTGLPVNVTVDSFSAPLAGTRPLSLGLDGGLEDPLFSQYEQATYPPAEGEDPLSHSTPVSASPAAAFANMVGETCVTFGGCAASN